MKEHMLIVEDERIIVEDIANSLEKIGYKVSRGIPSGEEAIKKIEEIKPDLVLMDIVLSGKMTGTETALEIRTRFDIPVVYLTAHADEKTLEDAKVTGPYGFLLKPFEEKELYSTIKMALYKHKMEQKIKENEEKYRTLFEASPEAIYLFDTNKITIDCNAEAVKMSGLRKEEILGRSYEELGGFFKDIKTEIAELFSKSQDSLRIFDLAISNPGGKIYLEVFPSIIKKGKKIDAYQIIIRDITERKKIEKQLRQSHKMEIIGQMAAGIAHQLNTPLAVISARLQVLQTEFKSNKNTNHLEQVGKMLQSTEKMANIINGILGFSRVSDSRKELININSLIEEIVLFIDIKVREADIECIRNLGENIPMIPIDRNKLEQVFLNIILNAFDAMNSGGKLAISTGVVNINNKEYVSVKFEDTGEGMRDEVITQIFDPFFTTKPAGKGTGLGLSISYGFVKEHQGDILVQSEIGKGTSMEVVLPINFEELKK